MPSTPASASRCGLYRRRQSCPGATIGHDHSDSRLLPPEFPLASSCFSQPTEAEDGGFVRDSLKAPAKEIQEFVFPSGSSQASYAPPWTPNSQMYLAVLIALRCRYVVIMTNTSNKISSPACNSQKDLDLVGVVVADCCRSLPAAVGQKQPLNIYKTRDYSGLGFFPVVIVYWHASNPAATLTEVCTSIAA